MNLSLLDPFQSDFPEVIEEYLEHGVAKCIAFNRRGTLLAAGCTDGSCVIWDFDTRGVAKELRDKERTAPITTVSWSKCGYRLLISAVDKSLSLWDVYQGLKITTVMLQQPALHAQLHPGSSAPTVCLACPMSNAPVLVDFGSSTTCALPATTSNVSEAVTTSRNKGGEGSSMLSPATASFNKRGDLVYVGNSKGEILIIDVASKQVQAVVLVAGSPVIRQIVFSRNGRYLLTNSNDRIIRAYENLLPRDNAAQCLASLASVSQDSNLSDVLKRRAVECLRPIKEFQDAVNKLHWKAACFNNDGEFVVGGLASRGEHKIHIWNRNGQLIRILEGPKEGLTHLAWHPTRPVVVSVSMSGVVYLWAKDYTENWSAFAPDFKELVENEEYFEREDEFDIVPDTEKVKPSESEQMEPVDIMTLEKVAAFSDSDASQDGLLFLPTVPIPDTPEKQNPLKQPFDSPGKPQNASPGRSTAALEDANLKRSELGQFQAQNSFGGSNGSFRRKRKLSEKAAEYQASRGCKQSPKVQLGNSKHRIEVRHDLVSITAYQSHQQDYDFRDKIVTDQPADSEWDSPHEIHE